jgi:hypothetical protein
LATATLFSLDSKNRLKKYKKKHVSLRRARLTNVQIYANKKKSRFCNAFPSRLLLSSTSTPWCLVHLDHTVNLSDEPETSEKSYRTGQQEEQKHHNQCVAKIQKGRRRILDLQFGHKVVTTVDEQVNGRKTGREERTPPPMIVLGAQMEVAQQNCRLRTRDDQNDKDQKEKAKHVVHLIRPQRVENEEQLDEDAAEG